jgi:hypothetical protein
MAKIKPPKETDRRQYREQLQRPEQRRAFDGLVKLIAAPKDTLAWHHEVGSLVAQFRPENPRGTQWSRELAKALGPSAELLEKSLRFTKEYPTPGDFAELERMGVHWTRLYFSFVIKDEKARHALLREAVDEDWSDRQLRLTIQERYPSNRRGVGGRPRRAVTGHGPEVALREMGWQCRNWAESYQGSWSKVTDGQWEQLVRDWPAGEREKLRKRLKDTAAAVKAVAKGCAAVGRALAKQLRQLPK